MTVQVDYTKSFEVINDSSLVDGVFYNHNDNTVTFDLNDRLYRYSNVSETDALKVAEADSAGREYQVFKRKFGPGEYLGEYDDVNWTKVDQKPTFTLSSGGGTFSGQTYTGTVNSNVVQLNVPTQKVNKFKVGFVVVEDNGFQGSVSEIKYHTLLAASLADAVSKVEELAKMLDLVFKVKEVTVYFD